MKQIVKDLVNEMYGHIANKGRDFMSQETLISQHWKKYPSESDNFESILPILSKNIQNQYKELKNNIIEQCSWDGIVDKEKSNQKEIEKHFPFHKALYSELYDYLEKEFGVSWIQAGLSKDVLTF